MWAPRDLCVSTRQCDYTVSRKKRSHFNFRHNCAISWEIFLYIIFEALCSGIIYACIYYILSLYYNALIQFVTNSQDTRSQFVDVLDPTFEALLLHYWPHFVVHRISSGQCGGQSMEWMKSGSTVLRASWAVALICWNTQLVFSGARPRTPLVGWGRGLPICFPLDAFGVSISSPILRLGCQVP